MSEILVGLFVGWAVFEATYMFAWYAGYRVGRFGDD